MRDPNSTLGTSAMTAIQAAAKRAADKFIDEEKVAKLNRRPDVVASRKAKAIRELEAEQWIAEVRARRGKP